MENGMQVTIETPQGSVTATITGGMIGSAEVAPDGGIRLSFFPMEAPPEESGGEGEFIGA